MALPSSLAILTATLIENHPTETPIRTPPPHRTAPVTRTASTPNHNEVILETTRRMSTKIRTEGPDHTNIPTDGQVPTLDIYRENTRNIHYRVNQGIYAFTRMHARSQVPMYRT